MNTRTRGLTRREFIATGACATGFAGLSGPAFAAAASNPYAEDIDRFRTTPPSLVQYQENRRFPCPQPKPRRIAIGPGDRIYVAAGKYVSILAADGSVVSEIGLESDVTCLGLGPAGELFVGLRNRIEVYQPSGRQRGRWEVPGARPWLTGIAVAGESVFAADAGGRVLLRYDLNGKVVATLGAKDKDRNIPGFIIPSPYFDVEAHPDGLLRVTNPGRHRVEAYTHSGDFELAWGKPSLGIEGFCGCCNPVAISLLPDGRIVTCEKGMPRVKVYRADGAFECVVAGVESFAANARPGRGEGDTIRAALDCAVDSKGQIYVLDLVSADIRVMSRKST